VRRCPSLVYAIFPVHQIPKFDLYLLHSVRPALLIEDFPLPVVFLREIESVVQPDLIQFGPTGYSARNMGIVHEAILSLGGSIDCNGDLHSEPPRFEANE
jgi:hypothetical protein